MALLSLIALVACSSPAQGPRPTLVLPGHSVADGKPYQLNRTIFRVSMSSVPLARVRCQFRHSSFDGQIEDTATVEWDPSTKAPPSRYISLFDKDATSQDVDVRCSSEVAVYGADGTSTGSLKLAYFFDQPRDGVLTGRLVDMNSNNVILDGGAGSPNGSVALKIERTSLTEIPGEDAIFSKTRSLDPLTPVVTELFKVVAEVAVDRAKANAESLTKEIVRGSICKLLYDYNNRGQVNLELFAFGNGEAPVVDGGDAGSEDGGDAGPAGIRETERNPRPVFAETCKTLESVRIEELAASSKTLARALAKDLVHLSFTALGTFGFPDDISPLVSTFERLTEGLIAGQSIGTERDVQTILLDLGSIPVPPARRGKAAGLDEGTWRCAVGAGIGVVRECLREGQCTGEELKRGLDREFRYVKPGHACHDELAEVDKHWPALRTILARAVDAFRPPPGTSANQTAKVVANVLFDMIETYPLWKEPARVRMKRFIPYTRTLVNAVLNGDTSDATVGATALVTTCIDDYFARNEGRGLPVTSDQFKKGMAILNGFSAYASTYSESPRAGEEGKTDAERERLRHEERRKAMSSLIEAGTDRKNRDGAVIVSLGVGVGFGGNWRYHRGGDMNNFTPQLSLPVGIALERLPGKRYIGLHGQLTALDIGQFAAVSSDSGELPKANVGTAVAFGLTGGILLGRAAYSVRLGGSFGYAPTFQPERSIRPGGVYGGFFLGTYVPFLDFN